MTENVISKLFFTDKCLKRDPSKRIEYEEFFQHPFLGNYRLFTNRIYIEYTDSSKSHTVVHGTCGGAKFQAY